MGDLQHLFEIFTKPDYESRYQVAKRTGTCLACRREVCAFTNVSARLEYAVSALCEECQDKYLGAGAGRD